MRTPPSRVLLPALLAAALLLPGTRAQAFSLSGIFGSPVDAELAAQVPQDKRKAMNDADYALACANQDVELARLKEELADRQADLAGQNTKLAKAQARAAEIALDLARQQAIMDNGLGKDEDNRKVMDTLAADRAKNEAERIQLKARVDQAALTVRTTAERVAAKEKTVAEFKARRGGGADAAKPAPAARAKAPEPPAPEPTVIINKEPGAPPPPPPAMPEADLQN